MKFRLQVITEIFCCMDLNFFIDNHVQGLVFLSLSTPPVLAKATGTCKAYMPQCIGHTQKALFYTALALIAVGISGHFVSLVALFVNQFENGTKQDDNAEEIMSQLQFQTVKTMLVIVTNHKVKAFQACLVVLFPVIGLIALPYIKPWSFRFGIPAICTLVATIAFLLGWDKYKDNISKGSPVTNVFRVLAASTLKMFHKLPTESSELYEKNQHNVQKLHHTGGLRFDISSHFFEKFILVQLQHSSFQKKKRKILYLL